MNRPAVLMITVMALAVIFSAPINGMNLFEGEDCIEPISLIRIETLPSDHLLREQAFRAELASLFKELPSSSNLTSAPAQTRGWHIDGYPIVKIRPYPAVSCSYWGFSMAISSFTAMGSQQWKECSGATKCSGTYRGKVTWTKFPVFLAENSKLLVEATVLTVASNTCGYRNIGSGVTIRGPSGLYIDVIESRSKKGSMQITIPRGKPNQTTAIEVTAKAANLYGSVVYKYKYN